MMKKQTYISKNSSYPTFDEYRRRQFLHVAAAVGIGVSTATLSVELDAKDKKVKNSKTEKSGKKEVKEQIILLAMNLAHKDFKEREKATVSLIKIGKECVKKKDTKIVEFIRTEMEKKKKSKDPEVKQRAKKILIAMAPPPPDIPVGDLEGGIPIAGDIAF